VARNRKRAKERRARRTDGAGRASADRPRVPAPRAEEPPNPIEHAAADVELADAQIALASALPGVQPEVPAVQPAPDGLGAQADQAEFAHEEELVEEELAEERQERAATAPALAGERPSLLARLIGFLQGSWRELQRVQWPDRRQVAQATAVVIGFVIVAGVFLGVADLAFSHLMNYILYGKP
jgi:preprotein translocase SecE subunit